MPANKAPLKYFLTIDNEFGCSSLNTFYASDWNPNIVALEISLH